MFAKLKPKTIVRLADERRKSREARRLDLNKRLAVKAQEHGPGSIWAEMLAENLREDATS